MASRGSIPAVKFCGLSHLADVDAINKLAPEYVGFVFWPKSKRLVDADQAQRLRAALDDSIRTVGVFVDEDAAVVASLFANGIISVAQLHGSEDEAYIAELRALAGDSLEIWKAFEVADADDIERANASSADLVLLDGGKGEGQAFPWDLLSAMRRPYALAGGLNPDNVGAALKQCAPVLVDVSSGIEGETLVGEGEEGGPREGKSSPHKDPQAMRAFMKHVRG